MKLVTLLLFYFSITFSNSEKTTKNETKSDSPYKIKDLLDNYKTENNVRYGKAIGVKNVEDNINMSRKIMKYNQSSHSEDEDSSTTYFGKDVFPPTNRRTEPPDGNFPYSSPSKYAFRKPMKYQKKMKSKSEDREMHSESRTVSFVTGVDHQQKSHTDDLFANGYTHDILKLRNNNARRISKLQGSSQSSHKDYNLQEVTAAAFNDQFIPDKSEFSFDAKIKLEKVFGTKVPDKIAKNHELKQSTLSHFSPNPSNPSDDITYSAKLLHPFTRMPNFNYPITVSSNNYQRSKDPKNSPTANLRPNEDSTSKTSSTIFNKGPSAEFLERLKNLKNIHKKTNSTNMNSPQPSYKNPKPIENRNSFWKNKPSGTRNNFGTIKPSSGYNSNKFTTTAKVWSNNRKTVQTNSPTYKWNNNRMKPQQKRQQSQNENYNGVPTLTTKAPSYSSMYFESKKSKKHKDHQPNNSFPTMTYNAPVTNVKTTQNNAMNQNVDQKRKPYITHHNKLPDASTFLKVPPMRENSNFNAPTIQEELKPLIPINKAHSSFLEPLPLEPHDIDSHTKYPFLSGLDPFSILNDNNDIDNKEIHQDDKITQNAAPHDLHWSPDGIMDKKNVHHRQSNKGNIDFNFPTNQQHDIQNEDKINEQLNKKIITPDAGSQSFHPEYKFPTSPLVKLGFSMENNSSVKIERDVWKNIPQSDPIRNINHNLKPIVDNEAYDFLRILENPITNKPKSYSNNFFTTNKNINSQKKSIPFSHTDAPFPQSDPISTNPFLVNNFPQSDPISTNPFLVNNFPQSDPISTNPFLVNNFPQSDPISTNPFLVNNFPQSDPISTNPYQVNSFPQSDPTSTNPYLENNFPTIRPSEQYIPNTNQHQSKSSPPAFRNNSISNHFKNHFVATSFSNSGIKYPTDLRSPVSSPANPYTPPTLQSHTPVTPYRANNLHSNTPVTPYPSHTLHSNTPINSHSSLPSWSPQWQNGRTRAKKRKSFKSVIPNPVPFNISLSPFDEFLNDPSKYQNHPRTDMDGMPILINTKIIGSSSSPLSAQYAKIMGKPSITFHDEEENNFSNIYTLKPNKLDLKMNLIPSQTIDESNLKVVNGGKSTSGTDPENSELLDMQITVDSSEKIRSEMEQRMSQPMQVDTSFNNFYRHSAFRRLYDTHNPNLPGPHYGILRYVAHNPLVHTSSNVSGFSTTYRPKVEKYVRKTRRINKPGSDIAKMLDNANNSTHGVSISIPRTSDGRVDFDNKKVRTIDDGDGTSMQYRNVHAIVNPQTNIVISIPKDSDILKVLQKFRTKVGSRGKSFDNSTEPFNQTEKLEENLDIKNILKVLHRPTTEKIDYSNPVVDLPNNEKENSVSEAMVKLFNDSLNEENISIDELIQFFEMKDKELNETVTSDLMQLVNSNDEESDSPLVDGEKDIQVREKLIPSPHSIRDDDALLKVNNELNYMNFEYPNGYDNINNQYQENNERNISFQEYDHPPQFEESERGKLVDIEYYDNAKPITNESPYIYETSNVQTKNSIQDLNFNQERNEEIDIIDQYNQNNERNISFQEYDLSSHFEKNDKGKEDLIHDDKLFDIEYYDTVNPIADETPKVQTTNANQNFNSNQEVNKEIDFSHYLVTPQTTSLTSIKDQIEVPPVQKEALPIIDHDKRAKQLFQYDDHTEPESSKILKNDIHGVEFGTDSLKSIGALENSGTRKRDSAFSNLSKLLNLKKPSALPKISKSNELHLPNNYTESLFRDEVSKSKINPISDDHIGGTEKLKILPRNPIEKISRVPKLTSAYPYGNGGSTSYKMGHLSTNYNQKKHIYSPGTPILSYLNTPQYLMPSDLRLSKNSAISPYSNYPLSIDGFNSNIYGGGSYLDQTSPMILPQYKSPSHNVNGAFLNTHGPRLGLQFSSHPRYTRMIEAESSNIYSYKYKNRLAKDFPSYKIIRDDQKESDKTRKSGRGRHTAKLLENLASLKGLQKYREFSRNPRRYLQYKKLKLEKEPNRQSMYRNKVKRILNLGSKLNKVERLGKSLSDGGKIQKSLKEFTKVDRNRFISNIETSPKIPIIRPKKLKFLNDFPNEVNVTKEKYKVVAVQSSASHTQNSYIELTPKIIKSSYSTSVKPNSRDVNTTFSNARSPVKKFPSLKSIKHKNLTRKRYVTSDNFRKNIKLKSKKKIEDSADIDYIEPYFKD